MKRIALAVAGLLLLTGCPATTQLATTPATDVSSAAATAAKVCSAAGNVATAGRAAVQADAQQLGKAIPAQTLIDAGNRGQALADKCVTVASANTNLSIGASLSQAALSILTDPVAMADLIKDAAAVAAIIA